MAEKAAAVTTGTVAAGRLAKRLRALFPVGLPHAVCQLLRQAVAPGSGECKFKLPANVASVEVVVAPGDADHWTRMRFLEKARFPRQSSGSESRELTTFG